VTDPTTHGRVLELITSIVGYRHGNRTQRRLMGYKGGASVKVNVMLRDAATGRPVQAFMEKGSSSSGLLAGSNEEVQSKALKDVVENIAGEVKKYGRRKDDRETRDARRQNKSKGNREAQANSYNLPN